jgi:hypothetical protein
MAMSTLALQLPHNLLPFAPWFPSSWPPGLMLVIRSLISLISKAVTTLLEPRQLTWVEF